MAYNNHIKKTQSVTFAQSFERMKTLSPQEQDLYWNELSQMPIAHDIHFDMEEYNSKSTPGLNTTLSNIKLTTASSPCGP